MAGLLPDHKTLIECPRWPTTQWISRPVHSRLDRQVVGIERLGISATRSDAVAARVLAWSDPSPDALAELVKPFRARFARRSDRTHGAAAPLTLTIPSPISLRVDALVKRARERTVTYRHELIGALIMNAPTLADRLAEDFETYWMAVAVDAKLADGPKSEVLRKSTPDPGPRRWRQTSPKAARAS
jgi:hypothetical protein